MQPSRGVRQQPRERCLRLPTTPHDTYVHASPPDQHVRMPLHTQPHLPAGGCSPARLAATRRRFRTNGPGQLACQEGMDVPYPPTAPGFRAVPADVVAGGQQLGAGGVVQLNECLAACLMARRCTDVSFNAVLGSCYLKHGSSRATCQVDAPLMLCVLPHLVSTRLEPRDELLHGKLQLCSEPDRQRAGVRLRQLAVVVPGAATGPGTATWAGRTPCQRAAAMITHVCQHCFTLYDDDDDIER